MYSPIINYVWPVSDGKKVLGNTYRYVSKRRIKRALQNRYNPGIVVIEDKQRSVTDFLKAWCNFITKANVAIDIMKKQCNKD